MKHFIISLLVIVMMLTVIAMGTESLITMKRDYVGVSAYWITSFGLEVENSRVFLLGASRLGQAYVSRMPADTMELTMDSNNALVWKELRDEWNLSEVSRGKIDENSLARLYYQWGRRLALGGQINSSVSWFRAARLVAPWWSFFWAEEARGLVELGRVEEAKTILYRCELYLSPRKHCAQVLTDFLSLSTQPIGFMSQEIEQRMGP